MFFSLKGQNKTKDGKKKNKTKNQPYQHQRLEYNVEGRIANKLPAHTPPSEIILNSTAGSHSDLLSDIQRTV